ncbi:transporter substrate-binding domain-containing protein [Candidatus Dependentiae bacterium]|nr:transporter substrate-binding domain-containing protein [Candidatus Dependentiae bacterium]
MSKESLKKKLIIGTAGGYAPFVSMNDLGTYEGFDIDIAQAIAENMNIELEIKDIGSMSSLFIALEQGKIDAIIWALSITQERINKVTMVRYQGDNTKSYSIMCWKQTPYNATSINELKNTTICVEAGSCQEVALNKYPFIKKLSINHVDDGLLNIQYQKADGVLVEPTIAKKFKKK